jgi:4-amino-4-deoxy-L-arabinose transferase-like glycosyltransferase
MHAAQVGLVHMLYLPLISVGAPAGPAVLSAIILLVLGLSVYSICRQLFGVATGALGMSLLWSNATIVLVAVSPKLDVTFTLFLLLAHFALLMAGRWGVTPAHAFGLSGALLGFGFGAKYLAVPYGLAMLPTLALAAHRSGSGWRVYLKLLAVFLLSATVAALPWVLKNVALFGAPLYPFLSHRQLEPWLQGLYHTRYLPDAIHPESLEVLRQVRAPFNLHDFLFSPSRLTPEFDAGFFFPSPVVVVAPLALLVRNRTAAGFALAGVLYTIGVLAVSREINLRYLIPALPLLTIASAGAVGARLGRPTRAQAFALLALIALSLPAAISGAWFRLDRTSALALAFGRISRTDYLWGNPRMFEASYLQMVSRVNRQLSADSKVLMLFEARGYYLDPPVIQDNVFVNWSLFVPLAGSKDCLNTTHITHVLVNTEILRFLVYRGLRPEVINWARFEDFAEHCLERVQGLPDYELYRVRDRR